MFKSLGPLELGIILAIVILVFGAGKLGDIGGALGKSIHEFRKAKGGDEPETEKKPAQAA